MCFPLKASVIITTYRRSDYLLRAIKSALLQDYDDYEVIVVDDNGRESPFYHFNKSLIESLYSDKIRYLPLDINQGACNARNQGAAIANGEYLLFLDDDDEFLPNKISYQLNFLKSHSDYDIHLCSMNRLGEKGVAIVSKENNPRCEDFVSFSVDGNFFTTMMAIRKSVFLEVNGFDDIPRFQDQYFMLKLLKNGYRVKTEYVALYVMHEHNYSRITNTSLGNSIDSISIIEDYISSEKYKFTKSELEKISNKYMCMRASIFFQSKKYVNQLKALCIYVCVLFKRPSWSLFLMTLRCLVPVCVVEQYHRIFYMK